jgi:hypothetical protein
MSAFFFFNGLLCLIFSTIETTAIADKIVFTPLQDVKFIEEDLIRSLKAHTLFFVLDGICTLILFFQSVKEWPIFVLTLLMWVNDAFAFRYNKKIVEEMATVDLEKKLRMVNIIRLFISFSRFVCFFALIAASYIENVN